jgi:hypothetical protein
MDGVLAAGRHLRGKGDLVRTVLVQPWAAGEANFRPVELEPGEEITFGRGPAQGCPARVSVVLADPGVPRLAGRIRAVDDYWLVSNLNRSKTYVVENPEGGGEFIKVPPGRLNAPIPYEFSRVVLPTGGAQVSFLVFAPEHAYTAPEAAPDGLLPGEETTAAFSLDETAKYFLILVALCEPRLKDPASTVIPTVPQLLDRLADHPARSDLTRAAVNFHIQYLARTKLRVRDPEESGKADWQRAALVSLALRFNLVRPEHLTLLPADRGAGIA